MPASELQNLSSDPEAAVAQLQERSKETAVMVFKKSPICPISTMAETEFRQWLKTDPNLAYAFIDVIKAKPLARGLTAALGVEHQSPQALLFKDGALAWHDSHGALTQAGFQAALNG